MTETHIRVFMGILRLVSPQSGACYVFASTFVAYYAQARYRNCPLPLPSLAWPIDGAHMPGFRCLGLDGGFPFDQMR